MVKLVFLTDRFFSDYRHCDEIEKKRHRPHVQIELEIAGKLFCIPMRSHINHSHVLWTDKQNHCGIDFSKAVIITDPEMYIDRNNKPYIRPTEHAVLKKINEYEIRRRMLAYIKEYKKAKAHPEIPRNALLLKCSALQYFEENL